MKMYLYFDAVLGLDFMRCEDFRASLDRCFLLHLLIEMNLLCGILEGC